jgi:hypothetical protein
MRCAGGRLARTGRGDVVLNGSSRRRKGTRMGGQIEGGELAEPRKICSGSMAARVSLHAAIVDSADYAIISQNLDGTVITWDRNAEALCGYRADEIVGKPGGAGGTVIGASSITRDISPSDMQSELAATRSLLDSILRSSIRYSIIGKDPRVSHHIVERRSLSQLRFYCRGGHRQKLPDASLQPGAGVRRRPTAARQSVRRGPGGVEDDQARELLDQFSNPFLEKPFEAVRLRTLVRSWVPPRGPPSVELDLKSNVGADANALQPLHG